MGISGETALQTERTAHPKALRWEGVHLAGGTDRRCLGMEKENRRGWCEMTSER